MPVSPAGLSIPVQTDQTWGDVLRNGITQYLNIVTTAELNRAYTERVAPQPATAFPDTAINESQVAPAPSIGGFWNGLPVEMKAVVGLSSIALLLIVLKQVR